MKNNKLHKQGFTLIELLVVISIMAILSLISYTPFAHYQSKQRVVNSAKIISQVLNDSRNSAIYGLSTSSGNVDIGVLLKKGEDKIYILKYPYKIGDIPVDYSIFNNYSPEIIPLEKGVEITSDDALFAFKAITGSGIYKNISIDSDNKALITVGMKGASSGPLTKKIEYYTKTYISDVK